MPIAGDSGYNLKFQLKDEDNTTLNIGTGGLSMSKAHVVVSTPAGSTGSTTISTIGAQATVETVSYSVASGTWHSTTNVKAVDSSGQWSFQIKLDDGAGTILHGNTISIVVNEAIA